MHRIFHEILHIETPVFGFDSILNSYCSFLNVFFPEEIMTLFPQEKKKTGICYCRGYYFLNIILHKEKIFLVSSFCFSLVINHTNLT